MQEVSINWREGTRITREPNRYIVSTGMCCMLRDKHSILRMAFSRKVKAAIIEEGDIHMPITGKESSELVYI
jgi:hypothetical protein